MDGRGEDGKGERGEGVGWRGGGGASTGVGGLGAWAGSLRLARVEARAMAALRPHLRHSRSNFGVPKAAVPRGLIQDTRSETGGKRLFTAMPNTTITRSEASVPRDH